MSSDGLWDVEHEVTKPAGVDRVIVIGDSVPNDPTIPFVQRFPHATEALLNTRRETLEELDEAWVETRMSLMTYGLPDFTAFSVLGEKDRARIRRALEQTIAAFEPRLDRIHITLDAPRAHDRALRFRVDALLRIDPSPEPVTFDTVLQLPSQQYVVRGDD